MTGPISNIFGM